MVLACAADEKLLLQDMIDKWVINEPHAVKFINLCMVNTDGNAAAVWQPRSLVLSLKSWHSLSLSAYSKRTGLQLLCA
jgi:hypothetical protein